MSFRLILASRGRGEHRYGSDRHASAEWRHGVVFDAVCSDDDAPSLMDDFQPGGVFSTVHARLTLVVEPQQAERVLPRVELFPDARDMPRRIDGFVHVPPSFAAALGAGQVVARLGFSQDWEALSDWSAADRHGTRCAKLDATSVVVQIVEAAP